MLLLVGKVLGLVPGNLHGYSVRQWLSRSMAYRPSRAASVQRSRLQLRSRAKRGFVSCKPLLGGAARDKATVRKAAEESAVPLRGGHRKQNAAASGNARGKEDPRAKTFQPERSHSPRPQKNAADRGPRSM